MGVDERWSKETDIGEKVLKRTKNENFMMVLYWGPRYVMESQKSQSPNLKLKGTDDIKDGFCTLPDYMTFNVLK